MSDAALIWFLTGYACLLSAAGIWGGFWHGKIVRRFRMRLIEQFNVRDVQADARAQRRLRDKAENARDGAREDAVEFGNIADGAIRDRDKALAKAAEFEELYKDAYDDRAKLDGLYRRDGERLEELESELETMRTWAASMPPEPKTATESLMLEGDARARVEAKEAKEAEETFLDVVTEHEPGIAEAVLDEALGPGGRERGLREAALARAKRRMDAKRMLDRKGDNSQRPGTRAEEVTG